MIISHTTLLNLHMNHTHLVYANYIGPSVMTDANCEGFPICGDRIIENDRCVIKIIGKHCTFSKTICYKYGQCFRGVFIDMLISGDIHKWIANIMNI